MFCISQKTSRFNINFILPHTFNEALLTYFLILTLDEFQKWAHRHKLLNVKVFPLVAGNSQKIAKWPTSAVTLWPPPTEVRVHRMNTGQRQRKVHVHRVRCATGSVQKPVGPPSPPEMIITGVCAGCSSLESVKFCFVQRYSIRLGLFTGEYQCRSIKNEWMEVMEDTIGPPKKTAPIMTAAPCE